MFEATTADKYKNACNKGAHSDINVISPKRKERVPNVKEIDERRIYDLR